MSTSTTQQFDGPTIEDALGAAVATMGDDLEIIDAQKVLKRRRFGVRREERFEVIAAPRSRPDAEFEDVLRRMVDDVDDAERSLDVDLRGRTPKATVDLRDTRAIRPAGGGVDLADSDLSWWEGAEFVVPADPGAPRRSADRVADAARDTVEADVEVDARPTSVFAPVETARDADEPVAGGTATHVVSDAISDVANDVVPDAFTAALAAPIEPIAPVSPAAPLAVPAPSPTVVASVAGSSVPWSIDALAGLGLPPLVLERVGAFAPVSDLEWVAALAAAIGDLTDGLDTAGASVELTGYGRQAAVELIGGLCRGMRAGHLVIDGLRVEATPVELALGIRTRLQG